MTELSLSTLATLGKPEIIEPLDFESILTESKATFQQYATDRGIAYDASGLETDPVVSIFEARAYHELVLRARGNDIARARYLYFAKGAEVDHLGAFYDVVRLTGESDERFKERIVLAIRGRSTGGTEPRYRGVALGSSLRVDDVKVYVVAPSPVVNVAVFSTDNNGIPDQDLLDTVAAALNADDVKMINDTINVRSAVTQVVNVSAQMWLLPTTPGTLVDSIAAGLPAKWAAEGGIGRDLTISWLTAALMQTGIQRVSVTAPAANVVVDPYKAVRIGAVSLTIAGRDF